MHDREQIIAALDFLLWKWRDGLTSEGTLGKNTRHNCEADAQGRGILSSTGLVDSRGEYGVHKNEGAGELKEKNLDKFWISSR
jgi:hypothetical protein